jgi:hypothetical protein
MFLLTLMDYGCKNSVNGHWLALQQLQNFVLFRPHQQELSKIGNALNFAWKTWEPKMARTFFSQIRLGKTHLYQTTTSDQA